MRDVLAERWQGIRRTDHLALSLTLALGAAGGFVARALHLPLPFLTGALLTVAGAVLADLRLFGRPITLPLRFRFAFVPVIGLSIGGAFTPAVLDQAAGWWPSLALLCLFVPLAHSLGFWIFRRGGLPRAEAWFGAVPGGLIESVEMGQEAGADAALVTALQFLRLILTILTIPALFVLMTGHAVGSASGAQMPQGAGGLTPANIALMVATALAGVWLAKALRLPGAIITGPILVSCALHLSGHLTVGPPGWAVQGTQVILGAGLGARFVGMTRSLLLRAGRLALLNGVAGLSLALGFAIVLRAIGTAPVEAAFLAFAPGGLAEMSLIALSLHHSPVYVTAHHVLRILLSVSMAKIGWAWVRPLPPPGPPGPT